MIRKRRPLAALVLVSVIAVIGAGCGSNTATGTAGSASNTGSGASSGSPSNGANRQATTKQEKAVKFAQCMRKNGVSQFPDPGASGGFTIDQVANGSSLDTSTPAFTQALSACKRLEPAGFTGGTRSSAQQSAALRFAQCIRDNGVKDFPDPISGQPLVDTNRIPSANQPGGMSILNAAMHKCGGIARQAIGSQ
jgi:hypothetical protein